MTDWPAHCQTTARGRPALLGRLRDVACRPSPHTATHYTRHPLKFAEAGPRKLRRIRRRIGSNCCRPVHQRSTPSIGSAEVPPQGGLVLGVDELNAETLGVVAHHAGAQLLVAEHYFRAYFGARRRADGGARN